MSRIGFVLLTHAKPDQILRLVQRLNSMFGNPPIVCHHDFGKCPLPGGFLPPNVEFVRPHLDTGWGKFSAVKAIVFSLEQMYRRSDAPNWCMLLSGSCYPTKPAAQILENLEAGEYDAHIEGQEVRLDRQDDNWHRMFYERVCAKTFDIASLDKRLRPRTRRVYLPHVIGKHLLPFRDDLRCFAGSLWFRVNRRAAQCIIEFQQTPDGLALAKHYQNRLHCDESYFQTILFNTPGLKLNNDNWMYLDWSEKKANPKLLALEDLAAIQASPAHFARKFDEEKSVALLDALDQIIDAQLND